MVSLSVVTDVNYFHSMGSEHAVEYFSEGRQVEGFWQGELAEKEGLLDKEVTREDVERIANKTKGERLGLNVTYSAPKSVSIVYSLLKDDRIKLAHESAVRVANEFLEKNLAETRQGQGGKERVPVGGVAIANYTHEVSRSHDPQLHTHAVVLNAVIRATDGEIRALSNEKIFEYQKVLDQVYKNELASRLQEMGYAIEMKDKHGNFEIKGINEKIIQAFSERSQQIEGAVERLKSELNTSNEYKLRDIAAIESRDKKEYLSKEELEQKWEAKLNNLGITKDAVRQSVENAKETSRELTRGEIKEYVKEAIKVIHENESAFTKETLTEVSLRLSMSQVGGNEKAITLKDVEKAIKELRQDGYIKSLNQEYMTSKEMQKIEKDIIDRIQRTNGTEKAIETSREKIEKEIKAYEQKTGFNMTNDQRQAVLHVMKSTDKFIGLQGDAGTGKTTVFQYIRERLEEKGYQVRGIAPTGKASDELFRGAGIQSQTVDSFLMRFNQFTIVRDKEEYVKRYNEINQKFEARNWSAPKALFGGKSETWESQVGDFLKKELGINSEQKLNWFETKVQERAYVINRDDFTGKMIVENVKNAVGGLETHVWVRNEKTGDIYFSRYTHTDFGLSVKEVSEKFVHPEKTIEFGKEVWVVDESSMMGSKEVHQLINAAEQAGARVIFTGDVKQLASVEAGRIFQDMQELGLNTVRMTEKVRQKEIEYRQLVDRFGAQDWSAVQEKIDKITTEIKDDKERLSVIKNEYLKDPSKSLVVTARNSDREALNKAIREELKSQGKIDSKEYSCIVRESKNLSAEEKRYAFSYSQGDTVFANRDDLKAMGINTKSNEFTVVRVDIARNEITLKSLSNGKEYTIDTKTHGDKLSVYATKEINVSVGDRVITLKNDRQVGVKNGEMWIVKSIDGKGNITIKNENKEKTFNIKDYNYVSHGYAVTAYKSQGMTIDRVIYNANEKTNYNEAYTAITRGKLDCKIYTNDKERFTEKMKSEQEKTSTLLQKQEKVVEVKAEQKLSNSAGVEVGKGR